MRILTIRATAATLAIAAAVQPASAFGDVVLRRDGSKAVNVPADTSRVQTSPSATEEFDWGDAGIGAGTAVIALALGAAGGTSLRRRQTHATRERSRPAPASS
jgi:uncharacterized protein HemX